MNKRFIVIAGPCVIESEEITMKIAEELAEIVSSFNVEFYFKASFDKANRTSIHSFRGPGLKDGLAVLAKVKDTFHVKIAADIHEPYQASEAALVADLIQIPAFLCRQTDLLAAAAGTGRTINVKKGQFLAPWDMKWVAQKIQENGNTDIMLCERGNCFGYNRLVVDMTGIYEMKKLGYPVLFDGTHSVQRPGGGEGVTSGNREYVPYLCRAAVAAGADGLFLETHICPDEALSDGPNMLPLSHMKRLLKECITIYDALEKV